GVLWVSDEFEIFLVVRGWLAAVWGDGAGVVVALSVAVFGGAGGRVVGATRAGGGCGGVGNGGAQRGGVFKLQRPAAVGYLSVHAAALFVVVVSVDVRCRLGRVSAWMAKWGGAAEFRRGGVDAGRVRGAA